MPQSFDDRYEDDEYYVDYTQEVDTSSRGGRYQGPSGSGGGGRSGLQIGLLVAAGILGTALIIGMLFGDRGDPAQEAPPGTVISGESTTQVSNSSTTVQQQSSTTTTVNSSTTDTTTASSIDEGKALKQSITFALRDWATYVTNGETNDLKNYFDSEGPQYKKLVDAKTSTGQYKLEFKDETVTVPSKVDAKKDISVSVKFRAYKNNVKSDEYDTLFVMRKSDDGTWRVYEVKKP